MRGKVHNDDNMNNDPTGSERSVDADDDEIGVGDEDLDEFVLGGAEFSSLNNALDQLQGALDNLESRNAGIHEELLQLLQSNREVRRVMMEERQNSTSASGNGETEAAEKVSNLDAGAATSLFSPRDSEFQDKVSSGALNGLSEGHKVIESELAVLQKRFQSVDVSDKDANHQS